MKYLNCEKCWWGILKIIQVKKIFKNLTKYIQKNYSKILQVKAHIPMIWRLWSNSGQ